MAREGGDKVSIIGTADVEIKGPLGQDTAVNSVSTVPASDSYPSADYLPGYGPIEENGQLPAVDPEGNLNVRAKVLTDEGGYNFRPANSSLSISIGTCTFTNGSYTVTGSGFSNVEMHKGDYVYLDADGVSYGQEVDTFTDTSITLVDPYLGAGGTGASSRQNLMAKVGAGGTITVSNGFAIINSGTTASSVFELERDVDYLPITKVTSMAISQRIAKQDIYCGFYDENGGAAARWYFQFHFTGTDSTKVICECAWNPTTSPTGGEISSFTATIPNGLTTASQLRYKVEILKDRANFYINDVPVFTEYDCLPYPHDFQTSSIRVVNGTTPAQATLVTIKSDKCLNYDVVTTDQSSASNAINLGVPGVGGQVFVNDGTILNEILTTLQKIANPLSTDTNSRVRVLVDSITGSLTLGTVTTVTSLSQFAGVAANSFVADTMLSTWSNVVRPRIS